MVLVDTSVWIAHLRDSNTSLIKLLNNGQVLCHPFIIGELACGNIKNRLEILSLFQALPAVIVAEHKEAMQFMENYKLMGRGIGYVDIYLLASSALTSVPIWTYDKKLDGVAKKFDLSFRE
ncbi:MAG TPA: type II toxin-antitoxin system VapC family toxin [Actinobacteria bacterium]|nr:type II toxin-antitoxin system VapC family toxin [Actinomycetes bacterium]HEX21628.1 type II toxin-antitoxin system VapC family toxin [Actinomycetota bacterium]